jgi:phage tail-like protein
MAITNRQFLLRIEAPGRDQLIDLVEGVTRIGRTPENDLAFELDDLLRLHAEITRRDASVTIVSYADPKGRTPVNWNGNPLAASTPQPLASGDVIQIGMVTLTYIVSFENALEPEPEAPDAREIPSYALPTSVMRAPPPPHDYRLDLPPGLDFESIRFLNYLPGIYRTDFMSRFLAIFEAIWIPIEWNVANFDHFLDARTAPDEFLPWLSLWFFEPGWTEQKRRELLQEAFEIFSRRGTKWSMQRVLEILLGRNSRGQGPEVFDLLDDENPFLFVVKIPFRERDVNRELIERVVELQKPAHTTYRLEFRGRRNVEIKDVFSKLG